MRCSCLPLSVCLAATLTACLDAPTANNQTPPPLQPPLTGTDDAGNPFTIAPETRIIPDDVPVTVEPDKLTFELGAVDAEALTPGNILVGTAGEGYLRRVVSVSEQNGQVVVTTEQAALVDVVYEGHVSGVAEIAAGQGGAPGFLAQGVSLRPQGTWSLNATLLTGETAGVAGSLVLQGDLTFNPRFVFDIDIARAKVVYFDGHVEGQLAADLMLVASIGQQVTFKAEKRLADFPLPKVTFWLGPVPVVVTFKAGLVGGAQALAQADASVSGGFTYDAASQYGAKYENQDWTKIEHQTHDFGVVEPQLDASIAGQARAYVNLVVASKVYGKLGPEVGAGPYISVPMDPLGAPVWQVLGGFAGSVTFEMQVFDKVLLSYKHDLFEFEKVLYDPTDPQNDTVPPDTSILTGPLGEHSSANATFSFTGQDDGGVFSHFECALGSGTTKPIFPWGPCTSPKTYSNLADGPYTFWVQAVDVAYNYDPTPANRMFTVNTVVPDTTAPQTFIDSGPQGATNTSANQIGFSCDEGTCTYECNLNGGGWATCTSPKIYSDQADNSYTLQVRATDEAGNTDQSPASRSWTVDTVDPIVTIDSGPPDSSTNTTATFTFSCNESCTLYCALNGNGFGVCGSPTSYSSLAVTTHTFAVYGVDAAGNAANAVTDVFAVTSASGGAPVTDGPNWPIPDTGQSTCYNATVAITCPSSAEAFYGQDAQYATNPMSFTNHGDGTVSDNVTGLMWQREDDNTTRTWANAISYCDALTLAGYSDWRLPNEWELQSIVNYGTYNPSIDTTAFPNTNSSFYWSSSTYAANTYDAWYVSFNYGNVYSYYKASNYYVRCVR